MQNEERLTPAERELEAALGGLRPASAAIDRDRLMYHAGQVAGRRHQRIWQGGTAMLAAVLTTSLLIRPAPRQVDRYVYVDAGSPSRTADVRTAHEAGTADDAVRGSLTQDVTGYVRLREAVLVRGIDALPVAPGGSATVGEPLPRVERLLKVAPPAENQWDLLGIERFIAPGERL